MIAGLDAN
ncbi:Protein of unknown function [Pyronema omphalodes CBS 100304]|uniref:Uncharacterized protein n=1 Tax=Pyronema omphalodes (strain CBS 100304) TaxID=1076935 RepID=U4LVP7_PYROM|nr:Protein of unknown function [Pyronema omphalodes CBS 100304]